MQCFICNVTRDAQAGDAPQSSRLSPKVVVDGTPFEVRPSEVRPAAAFTDGKELFQVSVMVVGYAVSHAGCNRRSRFAGGICGESAQIVKNSMHRPMRPIFEYLTATSTPGNDFLIPNRPLNTMYAPVTLVFDVVRAQLL